MLGPNRLQSESERSLKLIILMYHAKRAANNSDLV